MKPQSTQPGTVRPIWKEGDMAEPDFPAVGGVLQGRRPPQSVAVLVHERHDPAREEQRRPVRAGRDRQDRRRQRDSEGCGQHPVRQHDDQRIAQ